MTSHEEESLWTGTVSQDYQKQMLKTASEISIAWLSVIIIVLLTTTLMSPEFIIEFFWVSIIMFIIFLLSIFQYTLKALLDKYPEYRLTSEALICKDWTHFGRERITTMKLSDLQQMYIEMELSNKEADIYFFTKKFDDWHEVPDFKGSKAVFNFKSVDSPEKLIEALQSIIPFKKHPTLEDTYQRIA